MDTNSHNNTDSEQQAARSLEMLSQIPVEISVEIGRVKMPIGKLLQLSPGAIIELDVLAGEPLNVYVNGVIIAQGEVVVVNEKFGVRLTDVVAPAERTEHMAQNGKKTRKS